MPRSPKSPRCIYPGSHATNRPILDVLANLANEPCASFYLDTIAGMGNPASAEGEDHHQGIARTHKLSDDSVYWFLSHSETDDEDQGSISVYRYEGGLDIEHVEQIDPLTVAKLQQTVLLREKHPSDICFLPDVDNLDAGYLFVTQEYTQHNLTVFRWNRKNGLSHVGDFPHGFPENGPNFVFIDRVGNDYFLGVASYHWGWLALFSAPAAELFPECREGGIHLGAFKPTTPGPMFPFPLALSNSPSQGKLVRDSVGAWYYLAFRGDADGDPRSDDFVDVYGVSFYPFMITPLLHSVHVTFNPGDTGFVNTGTHYVEPGGRLLLSSSYRWAEDEGPEDSGYVSRIDECASN